MRIRIDYTWRVIATLITGAVFAAFIYLNTIKINHSWIALTDDTVAAFLTVAAMAGGIGLGFERIRSRGDGKAWGIGRWFWSLSALSIVLTGSRLGIEKPWRRWNLGNDVVKGIITFVFNELQSNIHELSVYFLVFFLASRLARFPRDAAPDFREWSGRAFGCLVIVWGAALTLISVLRAGIPRE